MSGSQKVNRFQVWPVVVAFVVMALVASCVLQYDVDPSDIDFDVKIFKLKARGEAMSNDGVSAKLLEDGDDDSTATGDESAAEPSGNSGDATQAGCSYLNHLYLDIDPENATPSVLYQEGRYFHADLSYKDGKRIQVAGMPDQNLKVRLRVFAFDIYQWPEYSFIFDNASVNAMTISAVDCGEGHAPIMEVCFDNGSCFDASSTGSSSGGDKDVEVGGDTGEDSEVPPGDLDEETPDQAEDDTVENPPGDDDLEPGQEDDIADEAELEPEAAACVPDPEANPTSDIQNAEDIIDLDSSTPTGHAEVITSNNSDVGDYVKLTLTESDYQDNDGNKELVFPIRVRDDYDYVFLIRYVVSSNWGKVEVYMDDETDPVEPTAGSTAVNLDVPEQWLEGYDAKLKPEPVGYRAICLNRGDHILRLRSVDTDSDGYSIGVDEIQILPDSNR